MELAALVVGLDLVHISFLKKLQIFLFSLKQSIWNIYASYNKNTFEFSQDRTYIYDLYRFQEGKNERQHGDVTLC